MTKPMIPLEMRLPIETIEQINQIAKLATVKPEQVARVLLVMALMRHEAKQK